MLGEHLLTDLESQSPVTARHPPSSGRANDSFDGVDAPKRHRCAKVEVSTTLLDGGVHGEG